MGTRGRISRAALEVVRPGELDVVQRPAAPDYLGDEEAAERVAVVDRLSADWFPRETHGQLADYCRHVVRGRRIDQMIAAHMDSADFGLDALDKLYKMAERESRAASSLATRLRMTQQATMSAKTKAPTTVKKPWH